MATIYCSSAISGALPLETMVTAENADSLSVNLTKLHTGDDKTDLYQLAFPQKHENCVAGRVQTFLLKDSDEVSSSSMDYKVGSVEPSILFHMQSSKYDMAVSLQYCCSEGFSPGCKKMLVIPSVRALVK